MKLFSGTASIELTKKIARILSIPIVSSEVIRFGNSEVRVRVCEEVKNQTCVIVQSTTNPTDTNLMELFFFCDALKRQEAKKIIAVIPYFGYAKQNIAHREGECVSANVVVRFLEAIGFNKVYTFDLHDEATGGVFFIPFKNLSAFPILASKLSDYFKKKGVDKARVVLVSPDLGAVEKVRNFGISFYKTADFSEAVIEKQRDLKTAHKANPLDLYGDVKGKIAVIVDDMVVSGSTLLPAVSLCLERGAKEVYSAIVHHDFTKDAPQKLKNSPLKKLFTTDTIPLKTEQKFEEMEEISVASAIAEELKNL